MLATTITCREHRMRMCLLRSAKVDWRMRFFVPGPLVLSGFLYGLSSIVVLGSAIVSVVVFPTLGAATAS
jgi:hypothetical protein